MAAYGDHRSMDSYEYDHLVPLELGGATNDPRNLWPEPGASPNQKDKVESELNRQVCGRRMTLAQAQNAIATNWLRLSEDLVPPRSQQRPTRREPTVPPPPAAWCSASAQYSSRYSDYDVYVHSNQPDRAVTVTDTAGNAHSWHTDSAGYADVYLRVSGSPAGQRVTARVGAATCVTTLP
jgi:hypothetical protein